MSREATLNTLKHRPVIAPSMLKCDFGNLATEVSRLEQAGAEVFHWDIMDGQFVDNLSYGAMVVKSVRPVTNQVFDGHLMIANPEKYLDDFINAGFDCLTVHIEAVPDPGSLLKKIRDANIVSGLVLNPGTPVEQLKPWLDDCDQILVMSVHPGFGGQSFMPEVLSKVERLRAWLSPEQVISIDGGIGPGTISESSAAGAEFFVVGSAIFEADDYSSAMDALVHEARQSQRSPSTEL